MIECNVRPLRVSERGGVGQKSDEAIRSIDVLIGIRLVPTPRLRVIIPRHVVIEPRFRLVVLAGKSKVSVSRSGVRAARADAVGAIPTRRLQLKQRK